jgi:HEAT repeat protein
LISALKESESEFKNKVAYVLGQIGPAAKDAVPALITASSFSGPEVRQAAAEALKRIRGH